MHQHQPSKDIAKKVTDATFTWVTPSNNPVPVTSKMPNAATSKIPKWTKWNLPSFALIRLRRLSPEFTHQTRMVMLHSQKSSSLIALGLHHQHQRKVHSELESQWLLLLPVQYICFIDLRGFKLGNVIIILWIILRFRIDL